MRVGSGCLFMFGVCPSSKCIDISREGKVQGGAEEGVIYKKRKREGGWARRNKSSL